MKTTKSAQKRLKKTKLSRKSNLYGIRSLRVKRQDGTWRAFPKRQLRSFLEFVSLAKAK